MKPTPHLLRSALSLSTCLLLVGLVLPSMLVQADEAKTKAVKVGEIKLSVPEGWKVEPPANRLRLGQFRVPAVKGDKEDAEISIFNFGAGGTVQQQVQRWVGQFQPAGRKMKASTGKSPLGDYVIVELEGTYKKPTGPPILRKTSPMPNARMVVVMLAVEKQGNYFLKFVGSDKTVADNRAAFRASFQADAKSEKPLDFDS